MSSRKRQKLDAPDEAALERALQCCTRGELNAARAELESLATRNVENAQVIGMLGVVLKGLGRIDEAAQYLRHTVHLAPRSERASIGLFHCEVRLGRVDSAFEEMRRFLKIRDSEEYRRLVDEILQGRQAT